MAKSIDVSVGPDAGNAELELTPKDIGLLRTAIRGNWGVLKMPPNDAKRFGDYIVPNPYEDARGQRVSGCNAYQATAKAQIWINSMDVPKNEPYGLRLRQ